MKHIWVVEVKENGVWLPTSWTSIGRANGRSLLVQVKNYHTARLVKYYSDYVMYPSKDALARICK